MQFIIRNDDGKEMQVLDHAPSKKEDWTHVVLAFWMKSDGKDNDIRVANLTMWRGAYRAVKTRWYHKWLDKFIQPISRAEYLSDNYFDGTKRK